MKSKKRKIALILPGAICLSPFVRIYTRILDKTNTDYSIISWNREGDDKPEGFQYNVPCSNGNDSAGLSSYLGYIRFIKKTVRKEGFDRIIVFGSQLTCLLSMFLLCHYKGRYMIDYRDLSIEQKFGFKQLFSLMLKYSCANVISSPGFKKCLPKGNYYLSHNFDENAVREALDSNAKESGFNIEGGVDVLTIGAIRDYSSNIEVVKALANQEGFSARFVGKGSVSTLLEGYCKHNNVKNVFFKGFYQKPEEAEYVRSCTFMNIFYPRIVTHDTALSNRFYNSLIYRKPMIVTKNTCQGDYAEKYHVGVAIDECSNLTEKLRWFLQQDYVEYCNQCDILLNRFMEDQELFVNAVIEFISYDS